MSNKRATEQVATRDPRAGALAVLNFKADAGKGMEGVDKDSYAIPFLVVLQPGSPQINSETPMPNAKAGMFINSVTNELYERPILVPCAFQRRHVRWGAREVGGGFKGEYTTAQQNELKIRGEVKDLDNRLYFPETDGSVNPKKSDRLSDTRNHFVLLLRDPDDDLPVPMVFALASTGIKVSKNWIARIDGVKLRDGDNKAYTPASFSHMYQAKTIFKSNDKGKWWQPEIDILGQVKTQALYEAAKAFHKQVTEGKVDVAHDSLRDEPAAGGGNTDDDRI